MFQRWKTGLLKSLFAMAAMAAALPAYAQTTEQVDSTVDIVRPLTLVNTADLDFGRVIPGPTPGTITMAANNVVTSGGGAISAGGTDPARFYGYGTYNRIVGIRTFSNTITINRSGGGANMTISNLTMAATPVVPLQTAWRYFRIGAPDGFFSFSVGGQLNVGANQLPGIYNGTFTVELVYY
jgi:hypothetical protein